MSLELPNLVGRIIADLSPLKAGFTEAQREAKSFAASVTPDLTPKLRLDTTPMTRSLETAKAEIRAVGAEIAATAEASRAATAGAVSRLAAESFSTDPNSGVNQSLQRITGALRLASGRGGGRGVGLGAGGIVIAGLEIVTRQFDEAAKKVEALSVAFDQGKISGDEMAAEMLRSIPIAGQLGDAFSRLYSVLSGDDQYVAHLAEVTRLQEQDIKVVNDLRTAFSNYSANLHQQAERIQADIDRIGLTGLALQLHDIKVQGSFAIEGIAAGLDSILSKSPEIREATANLKAHAQAVDDAQKALDQAPRTIGVAGGVGGVGFIPNPALPDLQKNLSDAKAAADAAQKHLDDLTIGPKLSAANNMTLEMQRQTEASAQAIKDTVLGGLDKDFDTFKAHVIKVWDDIGKGIEAGNSRIAHAFDAIHEEIAAASGDAYGKMARDFAKIDQNPDDQAAYQKLIDQLKHTRDVQKQIDELKSKPLLPPWQQFTFQHSGFITPGSADVARLQFDDGLVSIQQNALPGAMAARQAQINALRGQITPSQVNAAKQQFDSRPLLGGGDGVFTEMLHALKDLVNIGRGQDSQASKDGPGSQPSVTFEVLDLK